MSYIVRYIKRCQPPGIPKSAVRTRRGIAFDDAVWTMLEEGKEESGT